MGGEMEIYMKKKLSILLAVCISLMFCAALVSCNPSEVDDEPNQTESLVNENNTEATTENPVDTSDEASEGTDESATESNENTENTEGTENESENGNENDTENETENENEEETTEGCTVEESEWEEIFSGDDLTATVDGDGVHQVIKYDGDKIHEFIEYSAGERNTYFEFLTEDNTEICYMYREGTLEGELQRFVDNDGIGNDMHDLLGRFFHPFAGLFASFEYDAETQSYFAASVTALLDASEREFTDVRVKLVNGALVEMTFASNGLLYSISDVGKTTVTLPEVYTVEESEWAEIFSSDNLILDHDNGYGTKTTTKYDGNEFYQSADYSAGESLAHISYIEIVTENGVEVCYSYSEESFAGDWVKRESYFVGDDLRRALMSYFHPFASMFESFEYDAETQSYVAESVSARVDGNDLEYNDLCVKMVNGRLIEMTFTSMDESYRVSDVGEVSVTIPEIKYGASEEEWKALMAGDDFDNVIISYEMNEESGMAIVNGQIACCETAMQLLDGSYVVMLDGEWHRISRESEFSSSYVAEKCDKESYTFKAMYLSQLADIYSSFTFDEETGYMVATDVVAFGEDEECSEMKILIRNGKILHIEYKTTDTGRGQETEVVKSYSFNGYGRITETEITANIPEYTVKN